MRPRISRSVVRVNVEHESTKMQTVKNELYAERAELIKSLQPKFPLWACIERAYAEDKYGVDANLPTHEWKASLKLAKAEQAKADKFKNIKDLIKAEMSKIDSFFSETKFDKFGNSWYSYRYQNEFRIAFYDHKGRNKAVSKFTNFGDYQSYVKEQLTEYKYTEKQ